mgnify:CR=1 FL=1
MKITIESIAKSRSQRPDSAIASVKSDVLTGLIAAGPRAQPLVVGSLLGLAVPPVVGALMVLAITGIGPLAAILCIRSHGQRK